MKKLTFLLVFLIMVFYSCGSTQKVMIQSFEPIPVDLNKIDQKDFSELISIVDNAYGGGKNTFQQAALFKEESSYIYVRVFSAVDESCYRVSINRNRSKVVNMQPDCSVSIE